MQAIIEEFAELAHDFNFMDYLQVLNVEQSREEYALTNDLALRRGLTEAGRSATCLPSIKKRHRDEAAHEATLCVIDGYQITRFLLGTWRKPVKYTVSGAEIIPNCERLLLRGLSYDWDDVMWSLTGPGIEAFQGMTDVTGTCLDRVLGHRTGQAARLTSMVEGLRLALAEEELFDLRSRVVV